MGLEHISTHQGQSTQDSGLKGRCKDMGQCNLLMGRSMKDSGRRTLCTGMESLLIRTKLSGKESM